MKFYEVEERPGRKALLNPKHIHRVSMTESGSVKYYHENLVTFVDCETMGEAKKEVNRFLHFIAGVE